MTTAELAQAFDVARSTLAEHPRKAESKILTAVMRSLGSHPAPRTPVRSGGGRFPKPTAKALHPS